MEVEVKFKVEGEVLKRVESTAEFLKEVREEDYYFNHPCRDFKESDEALRIRKSDRIILTYKGPKVDAETKTREEIEVEIDDFERTFKMLERLGFKFVAKVSKVRRIYALNDVKITVDRVEDLGEFVEIELKSEELEEAKKRIFDIAKTLGLKNPVRESYLELLSKKH